MKNNKKAINYINQIQKIDLKNNSNWMDILRLSFKHDPKKASKIMSRYIDDQKISNIVRKLVNVSKQMTESLPFVAEVSQIIMEFGKAKKLIYTAKNGADVKIQSYSPSTMTLNSKKFYFKIKKGLWKNYYLWDLYKKAQTPLNGIKNYLCKINIKIFSTPFDSSAVDILEKLNCPIYKIASFELTDLPLIKKVAQTKKPLIQ